MSPLSTVAAALAVAAMALETVLWFTQPARADEWPSRTVTVRVVDTDRTAGHQTLDTVSVDELWIRAVP